MNSIKVKYALLIISEHPRLLDETSKMLMTLFDKLKMKSINKIKTGHKNV